MEKKGNRNTSSSSRSPGTDLKKNQDVLTNKQGVRGTPRRREPPCGFSKTAEASRKPQPQRNAKASDKRPKPRGYYYSGNLSRNEETSLEEFEEIELGSVFSPGSKKQSLNHLLNFSLPPREQSQLDKIGKFKQNGKHLGTKKHKYNKEHFLQANCQFIVNQKGDYRKYMINPDALVDWDLIEQVNLQVNDEPLCPICLYPPVAAKITKCGHIFCWPCILHYLALSDKESRKCPICFDDINKNTLKSVIMIPHKTFNVDDTITFKLMKRQRGSLTAFPVDAQIHMENNVFNFSDLNQDNGYSKLFLANTENILKILDRENTELDILMLEDENCPEQCFMEEAKQLLDIRRNDVFESSKTQQHPQQTKSLDTIPGDPCLVSSIEVNSTDEPVQMIKVNHSESDTSLQSPKYHYFYQADDGQHIYLHAINAKMIEHSYGSLEFGPKTLSGTILEKEGGSMTEELRKKLRYLQHLPVTCQFEVAEIRLSEPIVTKESLEHFKEQIEIRRKRRKRREKDEKRREKRIQADENRKIGIFDTPNLHLDSMEQFPDVRMSHNMFPDFLDNRVRTESESTFLSLTDRSISPDLASSVSGLSLENTHAGPSFATMLTSTKKTSFPLLKKNKLTNQPSSTPIKLINATRPNMTAANINIRRRDSDIEVEDLGPTPLNRSFGDALAEALAKGLEENIDVVEDESSSAGKKKKKKNKHKLLFSTHMAFPGN